VDGGIRDVQEALLSLQELAALESRTLASETNAVGLLRERMSAAARFGETIAVKYQKINGNTNKEIERWDHLAEGFPLTEGRAPLAALLVVDRYTTVALENTKDGTDSGSGHFSGERLYLTRDKKWVIAERVGAYSIVPGTTSEWVAQCKALPDRALLSYYSLEIVTSALFAATNKVWEKLSPRMDAVRMRADRVQQIAAMLSELGTPPPRSSAPTPDDAPPSRPGSSVLYKVR
jgi:hypothetical protein